MRRQYVRCTYIYICIYSVYNVGKKCFGILVDVIHAADHIQPDVILVIRKFATKLKNMTISFRAHHRCRLRSCHRILYKSTAAQVHDGASEECSNSHCRLFLRMSHALGQPFHSWLVVR